MTLASDNCCDKKLLYEGKAKLLYEGPDSSLCIQCFKDCLTAFNAEKKATLDGKGVLNNLISSFLFICLEKCGVITHFVRTLSMREQLVRKLDMVLCEVVVRNAVAGSLEKRTGLKRGVWLTQSIVELYYKNDSLGDPLINEAHIISMGLASLKEIEDMKLIALRVNNILRGLLVGVGIYLIDAKFEFGRPIYKSFNCNDGDTIHNSSSGSNRNNVPNMILADEVSPDTCRLWDIKSQRILDKDIFRYDLGNVLEAYQEVANRLGIVRKGDTYEHRFVNEEIS